MKDLVRSGSRTDDFGYKLQVEELATRVGDQSCINLVFVELEYYLKSQICLQFLTCTRPSLIIAMVTDCVDCSKREYLCACVIVIASGFSDQQAEKFPRY